VFVGVIVGVIVGVAVFVWVTDAVKLTVGVTLGVSGGSSLVKQFVSKKVIFSNGVLKYPFSYQIVKTSPGLIWFPVDMKSSLQYL